jgi:hypothetical protein
MLRALVIQAATTGPCAPFRNASYDGCWPGVCSRLRRHVLPLLWLARTRIYASALSIAYPEEILPFNLRAKGISLSITVMFAAGFFNQYVNPIAFDAIRWKFCFVYLGCLVLDLWITHCVFPETKWLTLAEIAVAFEGLGHGGAGLKERERRVSRRVWWRASMLHNGVCRLIRAHLSTPILQFLDKGLFDSKYLMSLCHPSREPQASMTDKYEKSEQKRLLSPRRIALEPFHRVFRQL